jgi:hypothetical protein
MDGNMELRFGKIASSLTLIAAWAYSLGWIKTLYYFRTFGIGLESVELAPQDYLFASWYVIENVMFFLLLLWVVAVSGRRWPWLFVAAYLPVPLLTEWSYSHLDHWSCRWLVAVPHSVLKFLPFVVLIIVISVHRDSVSRLREFSWPHGNFALALLLIVAIAWSISAAKHFGSSEAKEVLRCPQKILQHVEFCVSDTAEELKLIGNQRCLYLLYFNSHRCMLLDITGYKFGPEKSSVGIIDIPTQKIKLIDSFREVQMDPGNLFWGNGYPCGSDCAKN